MHSAPSGGKAKPQALSLLAAERPRNVGWGQAGGLLFGDWGTSRLYVLGLAFFFAGPTSFYLVAGMSLLILGVAWAYSQICRIYPDGGGVYTAAKHKSQVLAVVGALLLFADYVVTASLSSLDGFHYFGLPRSTQIVRVDDAPANFALPETVRAHIEYDAPAKRLVTHAKIDEKEEADMLAEVGKDSYLGRKIEALGSLTRGSTLFAIDSPGLWAMIVILIIGGMNLLGPKHTGGFAIAAAVGMMFITLLIAVFALPKIDWTTLWDKIPKFKDAFASPGIMWLHFVAIVLALSGVEAIGNLTGVMKKPVAHTARKAIWIVAAEVAIFNILLCVAMIAMLNVADRDSHKEDMLAFLAQAYVGGWGEMAVRAIGGVLLLSAVNTVITDMISVQYLMSRDNELPMIFQKLNRFGVPWVPAVVATLVPVLVLVVSHDLEHLAALYAIGVVGAVAINITLCSTHPRLRRLHRKVPMLALGVLLMAIWITLACTKLHALLFVGIVLAIGLTFRAITKWLAERKGPRISLLRQAIAEQLTPEAMMKPKVLLGTYGSEALAPAALAEAKKSGSTLVVCFIRQVNLSYKYDEKRLTIDTDLAALKTFSKILDNAHELGVPVLPIYDTGPDAAELMAENAAIYGCERVLIGSSRQGILYHLIKGTFQRRLEAILPPEIPVQVIAASPVAVAEAPAETVAAN